jgi:hypothetical protein
MKRTLIAVLALSVFAAACGDDDDDNLTGPSNSNRPVFTAQLLPANEIPAVVGNETSGSGTATITFNITRDAQQTITAATADFDVRLTGFPAGMTLSAAHLHGGRTGQTNPPINNLGLGAAEFVVPASGSLNFTKNNIPFNSLNDVQNILNDPAGFYFNVHSVNNPGGVARGQLVLQ